MPSFTMSDKWENIDEPYPEFSNMQVPGHNKIHFVVREYHKTDIRAILKWAEVNNFLPVHSPTSPLGSCSKIKNLVQISDILERDGAHTQYLKTTHHDEE
uniref:Uncharacterized protein n=1 Tax=Kwoniella pini CBS 10737 TaxID=1296096 RepID=A0A1B9I9J6_9TREE|nr:uncharacterized protein I206_01422 [Kwoniella pini CBS 10737]OCF52137.1 hypothetical protein I206_01422 [Kwoniella pini CBS 10737]